MNFREYYLSCPRTFGIERELGVPEAEIKQAEERLGITLPAALREFYLTLGAWEVNHAYNQLMGPEDLRAVEDHLVFYEDEEGKSGWGIARAELRSSDPKVEQGLTERRRITWYPEQLSCAPFLLLMTLWQTLTGGIGYASFASVDGEFNDILPEWELRGKNGPMRIYTKPGLVFGVLYDEEEDISSLHAAATSSEALQSIHDEYEEHPWELIFENEPS